MKLRTDHIWPPIPVRHFDWSAVDDDTYDGPGSPIGYGSTEAEAIADLLAEIEARDPFGDVWSEHDLITASKKTQP